MPVKDRIEIVQGVWDSVQIRLYRNGRNNNEHQGVSVRRCFQCLQHADGVAPARDIDHIDAVFRKIACRVGQQPCLDINV